MAKKKPTRKARAVTGDVVGPVAAQPEIRPKFRSYYQSLIKLRDQMLQRQEGVTKDASDQPPTFSSHMADAGTDNFERDLALGIASSEQDVLYEIEGALNRIRTGTFGICELTGKPIEPERLQAIPWTRFTAEAEAELEKQGAVKRAGLGEQSTVAKVEATAEEEE
jgi:RNA polymerase-binding transcription factor DksA